MRRTVDDVAPGDETVRASDVRRRARQLLGRDSESLSDRMFVRILKDAHDAGIIDLRRRGDDFEVARAADAAPVSEQVAQAERAATPSVPVPPSTPRLGMGPRGAGPRGAGLRGRLSAPPPDLLAIGVVETASPAAPPARTESPAAVNGGPPAAPVPRGAKRVRGKAAKQAAPVPAVEVAPPKAKRARGGAKKAPGRAPRAKKGAGTPHES